jgi:acetylglutamate/LysW-gamma-L-alpha-aminoadipate kinase
VAGALGAATLVILSNVPGLLANFPDETSLIRHLHKGDMARAMDIAGGRMKKKVLAAQEALDLGVARIVLADSRQPIPISAAIAGEGTVITP